MLRGTDTTRNGPKCIHRPIKIKFSHADKRNFHFYYINFIFVIIVVIIIIIDISIFTAITLLLLFQFCIFQFRITTNFALVRQEFYENLQIYCFFSSNIFLCWIACTVTRMMYSMPTAILQRVLGWKSRSFARRISMIVYQNQIQRCSSDLVYMGISVLFVKFKQERSPLLKKS